MSQFNINPPTFGEPDLDLNPSPAWPKVVGIISIVWASLGMLCGGCGIAGLASQSFLLNMASQQQSGSGQSIPPVPDVMLATPLDYVGVVVGLFLSIVLLVAGILLLRRSPSARLLHLVYAGVGLVSAIASTAMQFNKQQALAAWAAQNADNFWAKQQQQGSVLTMIGLALGIILGCGYPIFLLVWFGLIKKRPEDMGPPPQEIVA